MQPKELALWALDVQRRCLLATDNLDDAILAAEHIINTQPGAKLSIGQDVQPLSAFFAFDIENRKAQGILNKAMKSVKGMTNRAKDDLKVVLTRGPRQSGEAILKFIDKYRLQLSKILTTTQLASLLEGAQDVAIDLPVLQPFTNAVFPASLEPKEAAELVDRLAQLSVDERSKEVYKLPADQQQYVQQAIAAKEAGAPPNRPLNLTAPVAGSPEYIHFPTIEEAAKQLAHKNVMTRDRFDALDAAVRAKSFTVASVDADNTLMKIRDTLAKNVEEGADYETFKSKVLEVVDEGTFMSERHLETVFRTNVQTAFSDGQMTVLQHPLVRKGFPYSAYNAIHDDRVRHDHRALEDKGIGGSNIFRTDDPVFQTFRPPWDFNCRCGWTPMTIRQAANEGITEAQHWLETGVEPSPPAFVKMPDFSPPAGFQRAISAAPLSIQLSLQSALAFSDVPPVELDSVLKSVYKEPLHPTKNDRPVLENEGNMRKRLFEYAIIQHPNLDDEVEDKSSEIIVPPTQVMAADECVARIMAARAIPEDKLDSLDYIEIVVRCFN